eukprot:TRINITY_DN5635_c0_g2_i1.p1 TRINITY_DN5635_c0_g2~~TRINITY_DN5635_c0_g2_i1.p1  ORF type:complete len:670 (-),score=113.39 TRINITY_DN5635_c0_g2_i1:136-2145(-)
MGDSPTRRLSLFKQAFVCTSCSRSILSSLTPRSRSKSQGAGAFKTVVASGDEATDRRSKSSYSVLAGSKDAQLTALAPSAFNGMLYPVQGSAGTLWDSCVEVHPDVICPQYDGLMAIYDSYEFLAPIGRGAFGRVLRARHRIGGQLRACKALVISSPLELDLVAAEVAILKALNHPNILHLRESYFEPSNSDRRKIYLITDLCTGGDLLFRIAYHYTTLKSPMTEAHVAYQLRQILSALMYCHRRGIVHRDIKPDNILYVDATASSSVKLIDFGLAGFARQLREKAVEVSLPRSKSLGRLAKLLPRGGAKWLHVRKVMMQRAGTAFYMAPEMIQAEFYDQKVDMFSIGAIVCEMLTGVHPFYTPAVDDIHSVQAKIIAPKPASLPSYLFEHISGEACDLCRRMLEKNPQQRLSAEEALAHAWFQNPLLPSPYGNINTGSLNSRVFEGLREYRRHNKLKQAALQVLAQDLHEEQIQELRDAFLALDAQGDGVLSPQELADGARRVHCRLDLEEARSLVACLGGAGQHAGYREFIAALAGSQVEYSLAQLRNCFERLSIDGLIRRENFERALCSCHTITDEEWETITESCSCGMEGIPSLSVGLDGFIGLMRGALGNVAQQAANCQAPALTSLHVYPEEVCMPPTEDEHRSLVEIEILLRCWQRCTEPICC